MWRQLKYQHKKSKTGISLQIILNVFKYLVVPLVPLKFLRLIVSSATLQCKT